MHWLKWKQNNVEFALPYQVSLEKLYTIAFEWNFYLFHSHISQDWHQKLAFKVPIVNLESLFAGQYRIIYPGPYPTH